MIYIYFLFAVPALLWEFVALYETKRVKSFFGNMSQIKGINYTPTMTSAGCLMILYFTWIVFGLFTSQWLIFLIIIILGLIPKNTVYARKLDSLITILLILFAIINQFNLHINLLSGF